MSDKTHARRGVQLGDRARSPRIKAVPREPVPVRDVRVIDGVAYETVWYPHRDAAPLLSDDYPTIIGGRYSDATDLDRVLRQTFGGSRWGQE